MAGIECRVSCAHALLNLIEQGRLLSGWSARLELSLVCSCPSGYKGSYLLRAEPRRFPLS
jgi:hypothetical protein